MLVEDEVINDPTWVDQVSFQQVLRSVAIAKLKSLEAKDGTIYSRVERNMEEWGFETEGCVFECMREERVVLMWVLEGMVLVFETELEEELEMVDELVETEVGVEDE